MDFPTRLQSRTAQTKGPRRTIIFWWIYLYTAVSELLQEKWTSYSDLASKSAKRLENTPVFHNINISYKIIQCCVLFWYVENERLIECCYIHYSLYLSHIITKVQGCLGNFIICLHPHFINFAFLASSEYTLAQKLCSHKKRSVGGGSRAWVHGLTFFYGT